MRDVAKSLEAAVLIVVSITLSACSGGAGDPPAGGGDAPIDAPAGDRGPAAAPPPPPPPPATAPAAPAPKTSLGSTDPEELNARFEHPSARTTAANVESVMTRVQLISLQFPDLAKVLGPKPCTDSGKEEASCACPDGGTAQYRPTTTTAPSDRATLFTYTGCKTGSSTLEGETYLHLRKAPDGTSVVRQLALFKVTRTTDGQNARAELDVAFRQTKPGSLGEFAFAVDGGVLVAAPSDSGLTIRDRFGSWACTGTAKGGSCTFLGADPRAASD